MQSIGKTHKNNRVHISQYNKFNDGIAVCPQCGSELVAKQGEINVWHFAHKQNQQNQQTDCKYRNGGEGINHFRKKSWFFKQLEIANLSPELEVYNNSLDWPLFTDIFCGQYLIELVDKQTPKSIRQKRYIYDHFVMLKQLWVLTDKPNIQFRGEDKILVKTPKMEAMSQNNLIFYIEDKELKALELSAKSYGYRKAYWYIKKEHNDLINNLINRINKKEEHFEAMRSYLK